MSRLLLVQLIPLMRIFKYWLPPILWAGVIFTFSSMTVTPTSQVYWQDFVVKKSAHLVEYFLFYIFIYRAFKNTTNISGANIYLLSLAIVVLYALSDEYHQSFTPGREPKLRD